MDKAKISRFKNYHLEYLKKMTCGYETIHYFVIQLVKISDIDMTEVKTITFDIPALY